MNKVETLQESSLRKTIAEEIKKDRAQTLRLTKEVLRSFHSTYNPAAGKLIQLLEGRINE